MLNTIQLMNSGDIDQEESTTIFSNEKIYMTPEGYNRLEKEFSNLKQERYQVVDIVSWAASNGDRSENADYQMGKRRLRQIDGRLRFLTHRINNAEIVRAEQQKNRNQVFFGAQVTYVNERDQELTVTIVGVDEANMNEHKISIASPVAKALLKARVNSEVVVQTPQGSEVLEILAIKYPEPDKIKLHR